jgi:hypothetical protein
MGARYSGGRSDLSEWPRSASEEAALSATRAPNIATVGTHVIPNKCAESVISLQCDRGRILRLHSGALRMTDRLVGCCSYERAKESIAEILAMLSLIYSSVCSKSASAARTAAMTKAENVQSLP